jgi:hypothetical protein
MKKLALFAAVAGAAAIFPAAAFASFTGVVVGKSPGALAIASKSGAIQTVHTRANARVGAWVRVNGSAVRVIGRALSVRIHAVVIRRAGSTTFLAGGHSLLAVHSGRRLASAFDNTQPTTGAVVNTTTQITPSGQLNAGSMTVVGTTSTIQVQALVTAVAAGSITVSVNGTPFTIALPAGIQLPASLVGQSVTLSLNLAGTQPTATEDDQQGDNNDQNDDNDDQGDGQGSGGGGGGGDD